MGLSGSLYAQPLPPQLAFVPSVEHSTAGVVVRFKIAPGYYLYRDKAHFSSQPQVDWGAIQAPVGQIKHDAFFGVQTIYRNEASWRLPYSHEMPKPYILTLDFQGCADVGICYPPTQAQFFIDHEGHIAPLKNALLDAAVAASRPETSSASALTPGLPPPHSSGGNLAQLLTFFLTGLGLSLTACMYPLLPIVSAVVLNGRQARMPAMLLSGAYAQGIALVYAALGAMAAATGSWLGPRLQQPWVIALSAAILGLMALSMFGVWRFQAPSFVQTWLHRQNTRLKGGNLLPAFAMGALSALIVGPCMAAPLATALGYIAQSGRVPVGALNLYVLGLGVGAPLMLMSVAGAALLPRAGQWMQRIQHFFGWLILWAAVYLLTGFVAYFWLVAAYCALLLAAAMYAWRSGCLKKFWAERLLGTMLAALALWFAITSALGQRTWLHDFLTLTQASTALSLYEDPTLWQAAIKEAQRLHPNEPVMIDFYATWCASCREMQLKTFSSPKVQQQIDLTKLYTLDVSANTIAQQRALREYGLYGPPGLFVLAPNGRSEPLLGFAEPETFIQWVRAHTPP